MKIGKKLKCRRIHKSYHGEGVERGKIKIDRKEKKKKAKRKKNKKNRGK